MMNRDQAWQLLCEYVKSPNLVKHVLAVEAAMRYYALQYHEDPEQWGVVGLLHDLDYEAFTEDHPAKAVSILTDKGLPQIQIDAIQGHGAAEATRETVLAKALYAVDELASFVVACALVRPTHFDGLSAKSVKKKLKDKSFAAAVDREQIQRGAEELGVDFTKHLQNVIDALTQRELELLKEGLSLIQ